ncbi:hypothetical protein IAE33_004300 [Pseudomonas sp. S60]|nr:hypothetical protein [Pseudomonas sp. S60]
MPGELPIPWPIKNCDCYWHCTQMQNVRLALELIIFALRETR